MRSVARRLPSSSAAADEGLVGRTDGIGAVQRAVDQRMVGRLVQHAPVVHVDAVDEEIGIERGLRHEGQHLACIGIQRHQRAALPSKACSATFCRPMSMDSMMSEPGTGSMRRSVRMGRPPAVTSTSSGRCVHAALLPRSSRCPSCRSRRCRGSCPAGRRAPDPRCRRRRCADTRAPSGRAVRRRETGRHGRRTGRLGFIQVVAQLQAGVAAGLGRAARSGAGRSG